MRNFWRDIKGTLQPFWITLGYLFKKPVTIQYPEEKRTPPPRYRARLVLTLSLIHISEPTRLKTRSRMPSSA